MNFTNEDTRRLIAACRNEARRLERLAGSRKNSGDSLVNYRAGLREEAGHFDRLAAIMAAGA
jgi:hypothetical protein